MNQSLSHEASRLASALIAATPKVAGPQRVLGLKSGETPEQAHQRAERVAASSCSECGSLVPAYRHICLARSA